MSNKGSSSQRPPAPKEQNKSTTPGGQGFKLAPLAPPDPKKYKAENYPTYVEHYKLYLHSLDAIKAERLLAKVEKREMKITLVPEEKGLARRYLLNKAWNEYNSTNHGIVVSTIGTYRSGMLKHVSPEVLGSAARSALNVSEPVDTSSLGAILSFFLREGVEEQCGVTTVLAVQGVQYKLCVGDIIRRSVKVEKIAKPVKPKGPAQTPKKVRTPEEQAVHDAKLKARSERSAWFREHKLLASKGSVLKGLAAQSARITSEVRAAAPSLTAEVHPDDGWKLVTHRRGRRERVVEVEKGESKKTTRRFTRALSVS